MNIKVLSAKKYAQKLKVTVQSSGKLGFSDDTAKALDLQNKSVYVKMLLDNDTQTLYMSVLDSQDDDSFKVCKSGNYFYLPTTQLFNDLGINYIDYTVIYDLLRCEQFDEDFGGKIYQMKQRIIKRRKDM
ncbi:MAG: hypothetical protein ACI3ZF_01780 [Candidatus Cryptobacteroides sp.]